MTTFDFPQQFDEKRLAYYRRYLQLYYNNEFVHGQGTENILNLIRKYSPGGDWIDLGSGTTTAFWSLAVTNANSIICSDKYPEALHVLKEFMQTGVIPPCYLDAMRHLNLDSFSLYLFLKKVRAFLILDALKEWPRELSDTQFDLITEIGTFGLAPTDSDYIKCFEYLLPHLKADGRVIGANWMRSKNFKPEDGIDNRYLHPSLIYDAARLYNMTVLECDQVLISGDPFYDSVLIFAMER